MCITVHQLAEAVEHLHSMRVCLVSRGASDDQLHLEAFGCLADVAEGTRVVAASMGQCDLMDAAASADTTALFTNATLLASHGPDRAVEKLNEVVVLADQGRVLDYGSQCIEQVVLNNHRDELWLMVACAVSASAELRILADTAE